MGDCFTIQYESNTVANKIKLNIGREQVFFLLSMNCHVVLNWTEQEERR